MSLVPKITRFTKLPELLKHKQEAEEKQKKGRQDRQDEKDRPPFVIEDEVALSRESLSEFKVKAQSREPQKPKSKDENIGGHIDLQV
ncbi:hypothetical protein [Gracilimonas sp.]|uniref:hypothetical protein n=1 Tax=Gracilimonas sp. TaxID=1974203 RepID=UPI0032EA96E2